LDLTFVATGGGDLEQQFAESGVDYVRLQRKLPVDLQLVLKLRRIIKDRGVQVVHAQQAVEAIHLWLATRGTSVKCVLSLQNYILDKKNRVATTLIVPRMHALVPVSMGMRSWFQNHEGFTITDKYHVVYNAVDSKRLGPTRLPDAPTLREELGLDDKHFLLGMVGNFYPDARKDQWTVCRALPQVMTRFADAHFVFVGAVHGGAHSYHKRCVDYCREHGIAERVHFVGKRSDIPDLLRELDLFVFSSLQEGLPVAVIEALLLAVPTIVSDIPPLLEVVGADTVEGPCAEIFQTGDPQDLTMKLTHLLENPEERRVLGDRAQRRASARFGIEGHLRSLSKLYKSLLST
jgi:glycosyltransferase involved in cell wall biosynthesis